MLEHTQKNTRGKHFSAFGYEAGDQTVSLAPHTLPPPPHIHQALLINTLNEFIVNEFGWDGDTNWPCRSRVCQMLIVSLIGASWS